MDNLAHTLIGIGVARSGLAQRFGRGTTATLAIASNLPDIDTLWAWWDPWTRFMLRREHSHALVIVPVLAALLAWALQWRYREQPWLRLFGLSALGIQLHIVFDLVNSFGVVILWPFDVHRFELACIFIIDLWIWGLMLLPMVGERWVPSPERRTRFYQASTAALGLYVLACVGARARAEALVRTELAREHLRADAIRVFPEPLGPHRFRAAARVGPAWRLYLCRVVTGGCEFREAVPTDDAAPAVAAARATPRGSDVEWFMAAPVWKVRSDGAVEVRDLRFHMLVVSRKDPFTVEFPPGPAVPRVR